MSQINNTLVLLKSLLKAQGLTYAALAKKLDISEASVKRLFAKQGVSMSRLEQICHCIDMSLSDLFVLLENQRDKVLELSVNQEKQLTDDPRLLLVTICVLNFWKFDEILSYYDFDRFELIQKLALLDKMKIIELLPGNRIKQLVHPDFNWITNGPIQSFFMKTVLGEFFHSQFNHSDETLIVRHGMLSKKDNLLLQKKLQETAKAFIQSCRSSKDLPVADRDGTALVIAMRPWVPSMFDEYKLSRPSEFFPSSRMK